MPDRNDVVPHDPAGVVTNPAVRVIETFADAKLDGSLRDAGMFVIGFVVIMSSALPGVPHNLLEWTGSITTVWFGGMMGLRSLRSFIRGEER